MCWSFTNIRSPAPSAFEQLAKEGCYFSGANVPRAVANGLLANLALPRRVVGKRVLNQRDKFTGRPVDSDPGRVEVFVQRRNDHRLSRGEVFANLDGASVAGKRIVLRPRKDAHVNVTVVAR